MNTILNDIHETQAEREERTAVICGPGMEETVPVDADEAVEDFYLPEPLNVCCPNPSVARATLCGCKGVPYV